MKKMAHIALVTFLTLSLGRFAEAENIPLMINYQGKVEAAGVPHNGPGYFKFSLVDDPTNPTVDYWTNDGSNPPGAGGEPTNRVTLSVNQGLFSVKLGDTSLTNMTPLTLPVFDSPSVYLRVWFSSDGTAFEQLIPDRQLVSVPYAYRAETAEQVPGLSASGTINAAGNPVDWTQLKGVPAGFADGTDDTGVSGGGTVTSVGTGAGLTGGPITTSGTVSVATGGITSAMIADGTITATDISDGAIGDTDISPTAAIVKSKISTTSTWAASDLPADGYAATYVNVTGDTMTGPLSLPSNGLAVGTSQLVVSGDNVGIGTATPSQLLEVQGTAPVVRINAAADGQGAFLRFSEAGTNKWAFYMRAADDKLVVYDFGASLDRFAITPGGDVGIGTITPGSKLSVVGLPTAPVATGGIAAGRGVVCVDSAGNLFIDDDGTIDCL